MPPTSPHHRAFFSNQPTIPTAGPQKGSASFLCPSLPLTRGISALPCATLRHIYTPFPRYSWCSFVSPSGFLRPIPKISKYFLARGDFFPKIWRANYGASRASLGGWPGGVSRFVSPCPPVPSVPVGLSDSQRQGKTSALPLPSLVPCNQFSPQNGLLYYTGRENGSTGLKWASVGLLLYCLRACPVKKGRKGEKSVSLACLPPLLARPVLCSASVALCRSVCRALSVVTG